MMLDRTSRYELEKRVNELYDLCFEKDGRIEKLEKELRDAKVMWGKAAKELEEKAMRELDLFVDIEVAS